MTPSTDERLRAAERAYRADPGDPAALDALRSARARAGVAAPVYWLVVPGGRDGRGRLHLLEAGMACWGSLRAERGSRPGLMVLRGTEDPRPGIPPTTCDRMVVNEPRWVDLAPGTSGRAQLCRRCDDSRHGWPVDRRWQLAWGAARGLPYPVDGAGAERVPDLLAQVERELAAVGRWVVLPGSGTEIRDLLLLRGGWVTVPRP